MSDVSSLPPTLAHLPFGGSGSGSGSGSVEENYYWFSRNKIMNSMTNLPEVLESVLAVALVFLARVRALAKIQQILQLFHPPKIHQKLV